MDEPELFRQGGFRLAARARTAKADAAQVARLREFAQQEDALADAVVEWLHQQDNRHGKSQDNGRPGAKRPSSDPNDLVDRVLAGRTTPDLPPALRAFRDQTEATPYWVDPVRLDRGARAITRAGLLGLFPLGDMSLMGGYLASRATKSLVGTGEIEHRAPRRLVETAAWWIDVTTPGALVRHGTGYQAALRIRLVHAQVRRAMNRRPDWDYERWDRPVNQVQTAGTLLLFSLVYVFGTQLLGLRYSAREKADILHLWRYVGWLMGVADELLPADEDDAWRLLWLLAVTEFVPDDDSKRLARALVDTHAAIGEGRGPLGKVLAQVNVGVHSAISRLVLGRSNADFLELPDNPVAQAAVLAAAGVNYAAETVRLLVPGATALQEAVGAFGRRRYLARMNAVFGRAPRGRGSGAAASGPIGSIRAAQ
ncbi:oxygenase MpaB family protein [Amycolatopsis benzoatilytica]|uniref:oxygenase MpaB family protein n=1 Tax=Amycolatopsis benzoatilytica TaxID=346045 RepID=UPI000369C339|nr:oxygenase MpaB family protein [Amycolatopsis benzoatilytica]